MNKKISFPIAITIIIACAVLTGLLAWQYGLIPGIEPSGLLPRPSEKEIIITSDKTEYEQGEIVKITLKNNLKESIFSHIGSGTPVFCIEYIERKTPAGAWEKLFAQCQYPHCIDDIDAPTEIRSGQSETFEWEPLIFIDGTSETVQAGLGQYRLSILYEDYQKTEWKSIYSNEFTIGEKDGTADCLKKYPVVLFEDCVPGEVVDGWWGTILYPNTLDTSDIEYYIDAPAPDIVKQAGIASYGASRSTCQTTWFIKINGEWEKTDQVEFCNHIIDYNSSCNNCLLEWTEGCC